MSPRYVPVRLSLSEILPSTRAVTKFSVITCWPEKVARPMSPLLPGLLPPLGAGQKGRYFWADGSTVILDGVQAGVVSGAEQSVPPRAATEGTVTRLEVPRDCRIPS